LLEWTKENHGCFETAQTAAKLKKKTLHIAEAIKGLPNPQQQQRESR